MLATAADVRAAIRNGDKLSPAVVDSLLAAADAAAKTFLRRNLESGTYTERVKAKRLGDWMHVREWPVASVEKTNVSRSVGLEVWNAGATRAFVSVTNTAVVLRETVAGVTSSQTLPFATNATLNAMQAAIAALPRWDAVVSTEVTGEEPSDELAELTGPIDVSDSKPKLLHLLDGYPPADWDLDDGTFKFTEIGTCEGETVLVKYVGGYAVIPADVTKAVAMIAAEIHAQDTTAVGAGMRREKLGDYEGERFQDNSPTVLTPTVQKLLAPYRSAIA